MIQETIYDTLINDATFQSIAGNRAYPMIMPQASNFPACVFSIVSVNPIRSLDSDANLDNVIVQFTCWADTYLESQNLAAAVRNAIIDSADLFSATVRSIDTQDPDTKKYGVIISFSMWWEVADIVVEYLLLETGDFILQENGDKIILET